MPKDNTDYRASSGGVHFYVVARALVYIVRQPYKFLILKLPIAALQKLEITLFQKVFPTKLNPIFMQ